MNPSGRVRFKEIVAANNAEAERIMARHRVDAHNEAQVKDRHVWPDAKPDVPQWRDEAPAVPGTYRWRNTAQWDEVKRQIDEHGNVYSFRFQQWVNAARVGGEWFY